MAPHIFVYILLFCFQNQHYSIHCTSGLSLRRSCQIVAGLLCFCLRTQGSSIELTKHNLCTSWFHRSQRFPFLPFAVTHTVGRLMANLNPHQLMMANSSFPPLEVGKSINCCHPFRCVELERFQPPPLPFAPAAGSALPARRAQVSKLVTYSHNLACELAYFVIWLLTYWSSICCPRDHKPCWNPQGGE